MDIRALAEKYVDRTNVYFFNEGNASDAYKTFGCQYLSEEQCYQFAVWAPNAASVSVIGDFNGWNGNANPMLRIEGGVWVTYIKEAYHGNRYKYRVTTWSGEVLEKADPYARYNEAGPRTASIVWKTEPFAWHDDGFMAKRKSMDKFDSPISIYEVHFGSWKKSSNPDAIYPNYREVAHELADYCKDMGYTHVELMPITEYPYDPSWGYQVTGYFSPTSKYGTPEDFAYFVDTLHSAGIGVIMDWVPAHFPKDAHGLARFDGTALYEDTDPLMAEHPDWGTLIFDYAKPGVRSFLMSSAAFFLDIYHIDGIRMDAVASMLYLDFGRQPGQWRPNWEGGNINYNSIHFLRRFNEEIHRRFYDTLIIAEESTAFPKITEPVALDGLGFDYKWNMGYMHDTLAYMQEDPIYRKYHHDQIKFSLCYAFSEKYILAYSHDEVVYGKGSMINKMSGDYYQKFHSLRTLWGFTFAHPGKKLMFMGSEFAQFNEWDYKKELDWSSLGFNMHQTMQNYVRALNHFYTSTPALYEQDRGWNGFTWLNDTDAERSALAFMRTAKDGTKVVAVCNFVPVRQDNFHIGLPCAGTLCVALNSDDQQFGGLSTPISETVDTVNEPFCGQPYSATLTVPPMSCVYYYFDDRKDTL